MAASKSWNTTRAPIGRRIVAAAIQHNMTLGDLAAEIGVAPNTVSRIVQGRTPGRFSDMVAIAQALGVSLDYLAGRTEDLGAHIPAFYKGMHT